MKYLCFTFVTSACLLFALGGCSNVCQDPSSPNFNRTAPCIDMTSSITGDYTGTLKDSINGNTSTTPVTLKVSRVNNSEVSVSLVSPSSAVFVGFSAIVSYASSGYFLSVNTDSTLSGAAATYGSQADGIFVSYGSQLSFYVESDTKTGAFEVFTGTRQ